MPSSLPDPGLFRIPPAAVARHPAVLLAPRELRAWIDALPLANPPRTAQMLIQQLRLLVRDPQPGNRFGALLELYDAPLDQLLQIVHERLQGNPDSAVPLDQLEYQLVELLVELAHGHLRLANDILRSGKEVPAAVLFRAMSLLDGATNIERLHYHRLTPDGWRLLLNIFVHAERQRTSRQAIRSASPQGSEPDTVRGLFFRSLVISLCDPHRHRPGQILSWVHWAGQHTDALQLSVLPQGAYTIPLDISGTLPPLSSARRGKPGPDIRYVATDAFLQQLQSDPMAPKGMRQALMDVIKGRKMPEQRQSQRQPRNHPYRLLYGLRAIHRRLSELTQGTAPHGQAFSPLACRQVNQSRSGAAFHALDSLRFVQVRQQRMHAPRLLIAPRSLDRVEPAGKLEVFSRAQQFLAVDALHLAIQIARRDVALLHEEHRLGHAQQQRVAALAAQDAFVEVGQRWHHGAHDKAPHGAHGGRLNGI